MSQPLKILLGVFGVLVVASIGLTMFGLPPNLPLGPLQGMFAEDDAETAIAGDPALDAGIGAGGFGAEDCLPDSGAGAGAVTDPLADPAAGAPAASDPSAAGGAIDPATGAPATTDPATGAPVASASEAWDGTERVVAAGAGEYDPGRVSDTVVAADALDPTTGAPVDPAAGGAIDPSAGAADPAATGAVDPAAGTAVDPCADGGAVDPLGDPAAVGATDPLADPAAGAGAGAAGTGAGAGAGVGGAAPGGNRTTTDGTNTGNSPEALRAAKDATSVMQKAKINVTTTATLVPSSGGIGAPAAVKRYRGTVTAAVLVMKLDSAAQQQWTGAGKKVQGDLVKSFLARLGKTYPKAARSITVVDETGNVLAIGDAAPRSTGRVRLF